MTPAAQPLQQEAHHFSPSMSSPLNLILPCANMFEAMRMRCGPLDLLWGSSVNRPGGMILLSM